MRSRSLFLALSLSLLTAWRAADAAAEPSIWSSSGSMNAAREQHTATLLQSGEVLACGGDSGQFRGGVLSSAETYDPSTGDWSSIGTMNTPREVHTATLLPSGKVLVAGGYTTGGGATSSTEIYDPGTGVWTPTGSMSTARQSHTATLLPSGKVLVAGGGSASAELFDPVHGTWSSTGSMSTVRTSHTATLLQSGKVLVAGGDDGSGAVSGAEIYDPGAGTWSSAGTMTAARELHTATLLQSGEVLVTGGSPANNGSTSNAVKTADLFNPGTGSWTSTGAMAAARVSHTATLLPSGLVVVAGGAVATGSTTLGTAEVYDPTAGTWSATSSLATRREYHTATLLDDGTVLVAAGSTFSGALLSSSEIYVEAAGAFASTGAMTTARENQTATLLAGDRVLVAGGDSGGFGTGVLAAAQIYDASAGTWSATGSMAAARESHIAALLSSGEVLVAGGYNGTAVLSSAELFDPGAGTWSTTGAMTTIRYEHAASILQSGLVLVAGGVTGPNDLSTAELYDPGLGTWTATGSMTTVRLLHTATLLQSGKVLVVGGEDTIGTLNSAELYDPGTGTWTATGSMVADRRYSHTATLLASGKVLVAGGINGGHGGITAPAVVSTAEIYDPGTGSWTAVGSMRFARVYHTAALLSNGQVLVAGGEFNNAADGATELFDPTTGIWTQTGPLGAGRQAHSATLLSSGQVLVAGGDANVVAPASLLSSAELYTALAAPGAASGPAPANGATGVSTSVDLTWTAGAGATNRAVHFGTSSPPALAVSATTATTYSPGTLFASTMYFWRIDERNTGGTTTGTVYSFTTGAVPTPPGAASAPSPADGATGVTIVATLSWTAGSGATDRDVHFGRSNPPALVSSNITATTYDPGTMPTGTTYFWRIDEKNATGTTPGTVYSFTTGGTPAATTSAGGGGGGGGGGCAFGGDGSPGSLVPLAALVLALAHVRRSRRARVAR